MGNSSSRSTQKQRQRQRSQRGGDYGFSGPAFVSASGAPVESRMDQIDCMEVARPPPAIGGARKSKKRSSKSQRGGACGCNAQSQRGGGGGTGGYTVDVGSNDIGKMYSAVIPGNCATVPSRAMVGGKRQNQKQQRQRQRGGDSAASVYGLQSYSAGFDLNKPVEIPGGSAHYLDWTAYDNTCKGGARRSKKAKKAKKAKRKSQRRSRN